MDRIGRDRKGSGNGGQRTRFPGVEGVEVRNEFLSVGKFIGRKPGGFLIGALIAGPPDKVQEFAAPPTVDPRVQDLRDLILGFPVDDDWGRRGLYAVRNGVRCSGFEFYDVEYRMFSAHRLG